MAFEWDPDDEISQLYRENYNYRVVQKNEATLHFPKYLENY